MKTRKIRLLSALLALAMLLALLPTAAFAEDSTKIKYDCGKNGDNVIATLDTVTGVMTISGTGAMADYVVENDQPWYGQKGSIKKIVIENGVTTIGNTAFFRHTELTEVDMSNATSLEKIGQYAFVDSCTGVKTIDLSKAIKLKEIGKDAFYGCGVESVTFPQNSQLTEIGIEVFAHCNNLKNIVIPETVTKIGGSAFQYAGLTGIEIPASVTDIGNFAFEQTKLTSIKIPASVTNIGIFAFGCENLQTVTFADDSQLKIIGTNAFAGTPITSIEIPASVTNIRTYAFSRCNLLNSVTFAPGSKLETIGENAFSGCDNLQTVYYDGNNDGLKQSLQSQLGEKFKNGWTVKFETEGGSAVAQQNVKNGQTATKPTDPTKEGYKFGGWYDGDAKFDFDTPITKDTTLTAQWQLPEAPVTYKLTVTDGTAWVNGEQVTEAAEGDVVTIEANETAFDGMVFERWEVRKGDVKLENDRAAKTSFTMPDGMVQLEAMYQAAEVHDSGWDAATVVTGAVIGTGTAILAYHIGMEVYAEQVLGKDVAVPRTRAEVALLAWQLAGSPAVNGEGEPLSEAAQAQRWAVESGLMEPDAEGNFNGTKKMSKWNALRTLDAAKKMG